MGGVATFGGPVGWIISGVYFIGDTQGLWGDWGNAPIQNLNPTTIKP